MFRVAGGVLGGWLAIMAPAVVTLALRLREFDASGMPSFYALTLSVGWLTMLVALISLGQVSDRLRVRTGNRTLLPRIGVPLLALSGVALALAPDPGWLLAAWVVTQVPASAVIATALAESGDHVPLERRALTSGLVGAASIVALLLGTVVVRLTGDSSASGFVVPAVLGAVLALPLMVTASPATWADGTSTGGCSGITRATPAVLRAWPVFIVASFLLSWTTSTTNGFVVTFVQYVADTASDEVAGRATTTVILATLSAVVASLAAGPLLGARSRAPIAWTAGAAVCSVALVLMLVDPAGPGFLVAAVAFGIGFGIANGVELAVVLLLRPSSEHLGRDLGLFTAATTAPYVLVPALATLALAADPGSGVVVLFGLAAALSLTGAVATGTISRRIRRTVVPVDVSGEQPHRPLTPLPAQPPGQPQSPRPTGCDPGRGT